jgi:hypothetical protein
MTDGGHIAQEDLALYAMHGCSEEESAAMRAHVGACAACRAELEKVRRDLAVVAMSVEQHPLPEGARQRFIEKIEAAQEAGGHAIGAPVPIRREQQARSAAVWLPWTMAAAIALIAVWLGVKVTTLNRELGAETHELADLTDANAHAREVLELLTAPDAQHVVLTTGKTKPAPSARAVYQASRGCLILQASNLQPLPDKMAYELWVIPMSGKAPVPAGLFWPDATGSASLVMPKIPVGVEAKAFGVTIEKDEGSPWPTTPILLAGAAPAPK